jgi:hypothetical protein
VERYLHPRGLVLWHVHKVGVNATEDGLVGHYHDVFAAFHLHYDRFEAGHDVAVGLAALVAVVIPRGVSDWEKKSGGGGEATCRRREP